jgi:hypothetical protein
MGNLLSWLFIDPATEAGGPNGTPTPMNYTPWIVLIAATFLLAVYYWVEGRKRIPGLRDHGVWKYVIDRMTKQVIPWSLTGIPILFMRWAFDTSFFSWRIWQVGWVLWGFGIFVYWVYFFIREYPPLWVTYGKQIELSKYITPPRRRR